MLSGLCLVTEKVCAAIKNSDLNKKLNILVLGTGTGILTMFLRQHFSTFLEKITTVDNDAGVLLAGRDHFGFNAEHDPMIESVCADAHEFVWGQSANSFDLVIMDVNYEEDSVNISPPLKFFTPEFLNQLVEITCEEGGLIAINVVVSEDKNRKKVVQALKATAGCARFSSGMQEESNEVFYMAKGTFDKQAEGRLEDTDNRVEKMNQVMNALKLPKALLMNK